MSLRVLTWNLFHGRSVPGAGRSLRAEFAAMLAGWRWDVALLQEGPPWWARELAAASRACGAAALTSRNLGLPVRHAVAERWPDLIRSNGGGSNAILLRGAPRSALGRGAARRRGADRPFAHTRLRAWPERRVAQAARLPGGGLAVNYHGSARVELAREELGRLWEWALQLAAGEPIVLGGDLNLREHQLLGPPRAIHLAQRDVDHICTVGYAQAGEPEVLDRRVELSGERVELSDHPPLLASLAATGSRGD
ncbi:MAG: endonuclease/exonuclease/phosphatase family protein [Solirubrobacteraceae bacterium]